MSEIDCKYTNEVICPFCGYEHSESWDISEGVQECDKCAKKFYMTKDMTVEYSSTIIDCLNDKSKHDYRLVNGFETKTYPGKDNLVYRHCKKCSQYLWINKEELETP